jgi:hypothetical protein
MSATLLYPMADRTNFSSCGASGGYEVGIVPFPCRIQSHLRAVYETAPLKDHVVCYILQTWAYETFSVRTHASEKCRTLFISISLGRASTLVPSRFHGEKCELN